MSDMNVGATLEKWRTGQSRTVLQTICYSQMWQCDWWLSWSHLLWKRREVSELALDVIPLGRPTREQRHRALASSSGWHSSVQQPASIGRVRFRNDTSKFVHSMQIAGDHQNWWIWSLLIEFQKNHWFLMQIQCCSWKIRNPSILMAPVNLIQMYSLRF